MTQMGLGYGQLIQSGMRSGMDAYRADQQLAMSRIAQQADLEQQAFRMDAMRQEMEQRKQEAARFLQTEDANRQVFGAVMGAKSPVVNQDGSVTEDDWTQRLDPNVVQFADPKHQDMIVRYRSDAGGQGRKRAEIAQQFQAAKSSGHLKYVSPNLWRDFIDYGVPGVDINDAPDEIRFSAQNRAENKKTAYIDMMTLHPASDGSGPPAIDQGLRAQLGSMPPEIVEDHFRRVWMPQQNAEAEIQRDTAALLGSIPNLTPEKARAFVLARRGGLVNQEAVNISGRQRTDPLANDRIRWSIEQAKGAVEQAAKEYKAFNQDEKNTDGRLLPPTADEIELAKRSDSGWLTRDSTWHDAQAKVAAWQRYQDAIKGLDTAYKQAQAPTSPAMPGAVQQPQGAGSGATTTTAPVGAVPGAASPSPVDTIDEMIRRGMSDEEIEAAIAAGGIR